MRNDFCSNYLEHSAKGTTWKNVKYIKKIMGPNGKYIYFYTQAQLNAYNKTGKVSNVLSDKGKAEAKKTALKTTSLDTMVKNGLVAKGKTTAEKTANLQKNISDGEKKIAEALSKSSSSSSKKSSGSSSSKSSEKNIGKAKGSSSSKSSSSKEKSGSSKAASSKAKTSSEKTSKKIKNTAENTPITLDTLKKVYGKEDKDVNSFSGNATEFKNDMLSKYKEGSFGYLMAGSTAYKWSIQNGELVLKDYNTDKEVSFNEYLKDVKEFKEFQTNKKKK